MPSKADKQKVRDWQKQRAEEHDPPPSPEEIRRQLGWAIIEAEREQRDERND